jgi:hypothetical protein
MGVDNMNFDTKAHILNLYYIYALKMKGNGIFEM